MPNICMNSEDTMTKKACLNHDHSEKIIDVFRYCIRRDPYLAKYLDKQNEGFDTSQNMEKAQTGSNTMLRHNHH